MNCTQPVLPVPWDGRETLHRLRVVWCLCSNTHMDYRAKRSLAPEKSELLRQIPSVDELLRQPRMAKLVGRIPRELLVEVAREVLASVRAEITGEKGVSVIPIVPSDLEDVIAREVERILSRTLQPVINATGVILHTNLGRAPLSPAILDELRQTAIHYSNLEYDLEAGARGKRDVHTAELLTRLTGAEDAIVVNNCAAAILVVLTALAKDGEVIVSRGELTRHDTRYFLCTLKRQLSKRELRRFGLRNASIPIRAKRSVQPGAPAAD